MAAQAKAAIVQHLPTLPCFTGEGEDVVDCSLVESFQAWGNGGATWTGVPQGNETVGRKAYLSEDFDRLLNGRFYQALKVVWQLALESWQTQIFPVLVL